MIIIGHRGAKGLAPENTLDAIKHALKHHVDEVEFDVRVTKNGIPVLSHDSTLRIGDQTRVIAEHSLDELRHFKPNIAILAEALELVGNQARLHIEIKPGEPIKPIVSVLLACFSKNQLKPADILLASKDQKLLLSIHQLIPEAETVVIESWSGIRAGYRARQLGTRRISMNQKWLWVGFLMSIKRAGWHLTPYTINNPAKARRWQKYIYGVITDYPDRFSK
ncbi:MAG: glycerophosphodiester phosphodiesterase [Candidatus Saccharimonadales bacterium]